MLLTMLVCCSVLAFAQTREVTGTITDPNGLPVPGATVAVKGVKGGTSTDANGKFTIHIAGNQLLIVSGVGFETQEFKVGDSPNVTTPVCPKWS